MANIYLVKKLVYSMSIKYCNLSIYLVVWKPQSRYVIFIFQLVSNFASMIMTIESPYNASEKMSRMKRNKKSFYQ